MADNSILVLGSANTDMTIKVPRIPKAGETILGGKFASAPGGKGANQAVGAARAGGDVTFIARVGQDMFGTKAISGFIADGINVDYIIRDKTTPSGIALIFVGQKGQNSIAVASGANGNLTPSDVKRAAPAFRKARILLVQLEIPLKTVRAAIELAAGNDLRIVLNPAPAQKLPASLLANVDVLTPNEHEAELLTGIAVKNRASAARASERLLSLGVRNVIITMGEHGAFVACRQFTQFIPGHKTRTVDTTAAGDVFNGALTAALAEGQPLLDAARFANAAAALSVARPGAQDSAPTRAEIHRLLNNNGGVRYSAANRNNFNHNGARHFNELNGAA